MARKHCKSIIITFFDYFTYYILNHIYWKTGMAFKICPFIQDIYNRNIDYNYNHISHYYTINIKLTIVISTCYLKTNIIMVTA